VNRGDVWLIDLGGRIGRRPVVVLTRQSVVGLVNKVTVVEITTKGKGYPTEVDIGHKANLPKPSFVQADNLHTVPKQRLERYVGTIDAETMRIVSRKVVLSLELESCIFD